MNFPVFRGGVTRRATVPSAGICRAQHPDSLTEPSPRRRSRNMRRAALGAALTGALVAGGVAAASASASAATPVTVQAESYAAQSGAQVEPTADTGGGQNVGYLASGDWLRYDNVDLGAAGAITLGARLASDSGTTGSIQFRTGSATGTVLAGTVELFEDVSTRQARHHQIQKKQRW